MSNHYHLFIESNCATLSNGLQYLNGTYTQAFNRTHQRVGHVFQGRFKAILVQKNSYLLELARYIVLNPVRARVVREAKNWPWSSYAGTAGLAGRAECLTVDWILASFAKTKTKTKTKTAAQRRYMEFVQQGKNQPPPWERLTNQIYLGDE